MSSGGTQVLARRNGPAPPRRVARPGAVGRPPITWLSVINLARVPYGMTVLIGAGLLLPPQLKDMLAAIEDGPSTAALMISLGFFAFLSWYWARAVIAAEFGLSDTSSWRGIRVRGVAASELRREDLRMLRWTAYGPIALSVLICVILAARSDSPRVLVATVGAVLPVLLFVLFRRRSRFVGAIFPVWALIAGSVLLAGSQLQVLLPLIILLTAPFVPCRTLRGPLVFAAVSAAATGLYVAAVGWPAREVLLLSAVLALLPFIAWLAEAACRRSGRGLEGSDVAAQVPCAPRPSLASTLAGLVLLAVPLCLPLQAALHDASPDHWGVVAASVLSALPLLVVPVVLLKRVRAGFAWLFLAASVLAVAACVFASVARQWLLVPLAGLFACPPLLIEVTELRRASFRRLMAHAPIGAPYATGTICFGIVVMLVSAGLSFSSSDVGVADPGIFAAFMQNVSPVLLGSALILGPLTALSFRADAAVWRFALGPATLWTMAPPVLSLLLYWSLIVPYWFELHPVRVLGQSAENRPTLSEHLQSWSDACGGRRPIIVTISGGASRAGLAGAAVLARVDQIARAQNAAIYAISSVSGGSLGAAAYLAALAKGGGCTLPDGTTFADYAKDLARADAVGPLLAGFMFTDIPRAVFGVVDLLLAPSGGDRAGTLEQAFELNARHAAEGHGFDAAGFDQAFGSITGLRRPLWIANGTDRDTGTRLLTVPVRADNAGEWPFEGASDALAQLCSEVRISTALNNTARFPFLEPSGTVRGHKGCATARIAEPAAVIDGGYFDNSGLESALELAEWMERHGRSPVLVTVSGDGDSALPADQIVRCPSSWFLDPAAVRNQKHVWEPLGPIFGLYNVRSGHVDLLLRRAGQRYCQADHPRFFQFYLPAFGHETVPLNWVLSKTMADYIWEAMVGARAAPPWPELTAKELADLGPYLDGNKAELQRLAEQLGPRINKP